MFISRHTLKWTKTCRSSGDFPHAHTAHFLLNRHRRRPGQSRRRERRDAAGDVLPAAGRRAPAARTTTAPGSPAARACATSRAWTRTSPTPTVPGGGVATRTATASSAAACPNARSSNPVWQESSRRSSTRPTTGPCACSATARPPRHSPTNC